MSAPIIMPALPAPHLLCRFGTQDITVAHDMLVANEYRLPEKFEPGDVVIDIGAHIGAFAWACLDRKAGRVHCFEPEDANVMLLTLNATRHPGPGHLIIRDCAVSDRSGSVEITMPDGAQTAMPHIMASASERSYEVECVPIGQTLADIAGPIRLLKLDCEGSEYAILNAATPDMMARVQEIVGEIHYKFDPGITDQWLVATLGHLGFKVSIRNQAPDNRRFIAIFTATRRG